MGGKIFLLLFLQILSQVISFSRDLLENVEETKRYLKVMQDLQHFDNSLPFSNLNLDFFTDESSTSSPPGPSSTSRLLSKTNISPLYPGFGTHFSYIYVGNPPQRQSVIIDTGI